MFKNLLTVSFVVILVCESYRLSISRVFYTNLPLHRSLSPSDFLLLTYVIYLLFITKEIFLYNLTICFFLLSTLIILIPTLRQFQFQHNFILVLLAMLVCLSSTNNNLVSLVFSTELISITTFFIIFYNESYKKKININVVYFLVSNIVTFIFGILTCLLALNFFGTCDLDIICLQLSPTNHWFQILFLVYILLKLGQGPIIIFKFRFYRLPNVTDLLFYILVYTIFIWPYILFVFMKFTPFLSVIFTTTAAFIITFFLVYSVFFYSTFLDFIVFSSWTLTWFFFFLSL